MSTRKIKNRNRPRQKNRISSKQRRKKHGTKRKMSIKKGGSGTRKKRAGKRTQKLAALLALLAASRPPQATAQPGVEGDWQPQDFGLNAFPAPGIMAQMAAHMDGELPWFEVAAAATTAFKNRKLRTRRNRADKRYKQKYEIYANHKAPNDAEPQLPTNQERAAAHEKAFKEAYRMPFGMSERRGLYLKTGTRWQDQGNGTLKEIDEEEWKRQKEAELDMREEAAVLEAETAKHSEELANRDKELIERRNAQHNAQHKAENDGVPNLE